MSSFMKPVPQLELMRDVLGAVLLAKQGIQRVVDAFVFDAFNRTRLHLNDLDMRPIFSKVRFSFHPHRLPSAVCAGL